MKKTAVILLAILLVTMLGGCYKSELVMNVGYDGEVEMSTMFVAEQATFEALGAQTLDDYYKNFESVNSINETIQDPAYHIKVERVDENGNILQEGAKWPEEGKLVGTRMSVKVKNMSEAASSPVLEHNYYLTQLQKDDTGYGVEITEKRTLFGTKYEASGKISLKGNAEMQQYMMMGGEGDENAFEKASNSVTFKFPFAFSKNNADTKNFLGNKLTWTATNEAPEKEVDFEVFVINPVILAAGFIILILLIVILILALKKKKKPDAFFVDAEGNEIPVYDVEETDEAFEDDAEVLEEAQKTSEASEEPEESEEVLSFGDVMAENEEAEKTNE